MSLRQQGACAHDFPSTAGGDEHARETRMERQTTHLLTERRQRSTGHQAEAHEQHHGCRECVGRWTLEPFQRFRIAAPRNHVECCCRQINTANIRLAMRTQSIG